MRENYLDAPDAHPHELMNIIEHNELVVDTVDKNGGIFV
jgi:hypothetical protein